MLYIYNNFMTTKEVSILLQTPIAYIRKLIREFKLNAYKVGKEYRITEFDLKEYLESVKYGKQE